MSAAERPDKEKRGGVVVMLAIIALLLAGILVALVALVFRSPPSREARDSATNDDQVEEPPALAKSAETSSGTASTPDHEEHPAATVVISATRAYHRTTYETGVFLISAPTQVLLGPGEDSETIRILPEGATFTAIGRQGEYRLVRWTEGVDSFEGWVLVAATQTLAADRGEIAGTVYLSGTPPVMEVPTTRKGAELCRNKSLVHNAVVVNDGKLQDVLVRIEKKSVPGDWTAPHAHASLDQQDCMYVPRMQGVMTAQAIDILNDDTTLHNVEAFNGPDSYFSITLPRGASPITKEMPHEPTVLRLSCLFHPWERSFVVVTDHPFFAVTDQNGRFAIRGVPPGKYAVEALHSQYDVRRVADVTVAKGSSATVDFTFTTSDPPPVWNRNELSGLW